MATTNSFIQTKTPKKRKYVLYSEYEQTTRRMYKCFDGKFDYLRDWILDETKFLWRGLYACIAAICVMAIFVAFAIHRTEKIVARVDLQEALYEECRAD